MKNYVGKDLLKYLKNLLSTTKKVENPQFSMDLLSKHNLHTEYELRSSGKNCILQMTEPSPPIHSIREKKYSLRMPLQISH